MTETGSPLTILDAKARLETEGIHVNWNTSTSLWIAAALSDVGDGVKLSNDACSLLWDNDHWVAVFPAEGQCVYGVPGSLSELIPLIVAVYARYREGGTLRDAVREIVTDVDRYLLGRSAVPA